MQLPSSQGYDAAQAIPQEDDLDRWRFAADIFEVVLATPPNWSARIGVFGKWGEGKSTVLRFAEHMLKSKGSIVFTFTPWAIQNWNDLWEEFGARLSEALSDADIPLDETWAKTTLKQSGKWLESTGVSQVAETVAGLWGKDKLYNAAFGLLGRWLKYDGAQIQAIRENLKGQRLVVLIDDLDRCAPALIPQLLLSLRELLDLPGFTFILAFDDEIIAQSLTQANPAWVEGQNFLEKILDFRFHLPAVTPAQKEKLVSRSMVKYCDFVPIESTREIQDLLPDNPRKLKSLIRSLSALRPQISRHDSQELNWVDMWLAQMLRLESYRFFERLLKGDTLEEEAGVLYQLESRRSRRTREEEEPENQSLVRLLKEAGVQDTVTVERITRLITAARSRSSLQFRYMCQLAVRPHAVTWKEFRLLRASWDSDRRPEVVANWLSRHAIERAVSSEDVEEELFEAILGKRNDLLSAAAESQLIEDHESNLAQVTNLLEMMEQFLLGLGKVSVSRVQKVYAQILYWIGFRKNRADQLQRENEERFLLRVISTAPYELSTDLYEAILPDVWDLDVGDGSRKFRDSIREKCLSILGPKAGRQAIDLMGEEGAIRKLTEPGRFRAVKYLLFDPSSPIWKTSLRSDLMAMIQRGHQEQTVRLNCNDLLEILVRGREIGVDAVSPREIKALLSDQEFVTALWATVTSRAIQYRMQLHFVQVRSALLQSGTPESALPLTEELQARSAEESRIQAQATAGPKDESIVPTSLTFQENSGA